MATEPEIHSDRTLIASIAAHTRWGELTEVEDRSAATAAARAAFDAKFPNENARKAHFQRMALRSAQARRRSGEQVSP